MSLDYNLNEGNVIVMLLSLPRSNFYYLKPIKDHDKRLSLFFPQSVVSMTANCFERERTTLLFMRKS